MSMRYAVNLPNLGPFAEPGVVVNLATAAEDSGWEGFFVWDHILAMDRSQVADPWIVLAAVAQATTRLRIGPLVTPLARRRPWVVARQAVSLDRLSAGRLVLGVGLGTPPDVEFATFGEESDPRVRAAKLDEGLDVITGLWTGEEIDHHGAYYDVGPATFLPRPVQTPRIPIWVGAGVETLRALRRAARFDGVFPITSDGTTPRPEDVEEVATYVRTHRSTDAPFDVIVAGPPPEDPAAYAEAGVTWYQVGPHPETRSADEAAGWIEEGPPGS